MQKVRENLTLILLGLLPFHALLVTLGTKIAMGPGHAPLTIFAVWKEGVLAVILLIALFEIVSRSGGSGASAALKLDFLDWFIVALLFIAITLPIMRVGIPALMDDSFIFGFKYNFIPLIAFLILRRVPWSDVFKRRVFELLLIVGGLIAIFGFLSFFLPMGFFRALGYSDLHSLYVPTNSLAAFQQIGEMGLRRIQSTMSGPNQLGLWLLIPLSIFVLQPVPKRPFTSLLVYSFIGAYLAIAIFLTFSRSAWLAAAVIVVGAMDLQMAPKYFRMVFYPLIVVGCILVISATSFVPGVLYRAASTLDHLVKPYEAAMVMKANPIGLGLGSAGPASNRTSDACVTLPLFSDHSWASDRPNLCVFVGATQVQPLTHRCKCPFLPENWYLQIGVELGVLGMLLFLGLIGTILRRLHSLSTEPQTAAVFLAFLGISVAALFLHSWEDAAVAMTLWILISLFLPQRPATSPS
jgi:hypothetical protein